MIELTNDNTLICESCGEVIKAFTSSGDTLFCTSCGSRELDVYEDETN